jgi:hypothetical protein
VRKESFTTTRRKKMTVGELKKFIEDEGIADEAEIESSDDQVVAGAYPDCGAAVLCLNLVPGHNRDGEFFDSACDIYRRPGTESIEADPAYSGWRADGGYELGNVGGVLGVFDYYAAQDKFVLDEDRSPDLMDWGKLADGQP